MERRRVRLEVPLDDGFLFVRGSNTKLVESEERDGKR